MQIGNQYLLKKSLIGFVGPRRGANDEDYRKFLAAETYWLSNPGTAIITGGAIGSDTIAIMHALAWADLHETTVPLVICLPRPAAPPVVFHGTISHTYPGVNQHLFWLAYKRGGLIIAPERGDSLPAKNSFLNRDTYLVSLSTRLYASTLLSKHSGTAATIRRAKEQGIPVSVCGRNIEDKTARGD